MNGTHILNAECGVIAATPVGGSPHLGIVRDGDIVRLIYPDGTTTDYMVTTQSWRDPTLTPAATTAPAAPDNRRSNMNVIRFEWTVSTDYAVELSAAELLARLSAAGVDHLPDPLTVDALHEVFDDTMEVEAVLVGGSETPTNAVETTERQVDSIEIDGRLVFYYGQWRTSSDGAIR